MLWTEHSDVEQATVCYCDPYDYLAGADKAHHLLRAPMQLLYTGVQRDTWACELPLATKKLYYFFACETANGTIQYLGENGISNVPCTEDAYRLPYAFSSRFYQPPTWTGRSVWYQIFPDRFASENTTSDMVHYQPAREGFYGGTLRGITARIPYLLELGVTGVYLNPVFTSPSNHRYDTVDYQTVDPRLGTNADLLMLSEELHQNGIRLMLDGVFNHASRDCPQFQDVLRNGQRSKFWDWFIVYDEKRTCNRTIVELTSDVMKSAPPYECFAFAANMPKWNTENQEVADYLIGCAEKWTKLLQLDAWRLDVPDEISPRFLHQFRERIKSISAQISIIGEIWNAPYPWIGGNYFDGTMNYPLYFIMRDFFLKRILSVHAFCERLNQLLNDLPLSIQKNQLNFIANHDLPRPLTVADGSLAAVQKALTLLMLIDGEACMFYGDERAMQGGDDPLNRGAVDWSFTHPMTDFFKKLTSLRQQLLSSPLQSVQCCAVGSDCAIITFVRSAATYQVILYPDGTPYEDLRCDTAVPILSIEGLLLVKC